jgi:hypothetical protein
VRGSQAKILNVVIARAYDIIIKIQLNGTTLNAGKATNTACSTNSPRAACLHSVQALLVEI